MNGKSLLRSIMSTKSFKWFLRRTQRTGIILAKMGKGKYEEESDGQLLVKRGEAIKVKKARVYNIEVIDENYAPDTPKEYSALIELGQLDVETGIFILTSNIVWIDQKRDEEKELEASDFLLITG